MKAQRKLEKRVELRLRYHDEDTEDLEQLAFDLTHPKAGDDTCHAILGPYHSDNAQTFLSHAAQTRLPVVMPTCTSSNLQRANARNTYAWFLTESDITQCEIMLNVASTMNASDVALIYSDGTYGQSFYDWFAFFAAEHNIPLAGDGTLEYQHEGDSLFVMQDDSSIEIKKSQLRSYFYIQQVILEYLATRPPKEDVQQIVVNSVAFRELKKAKEEGHEPKDLFVPGTSFKIGVENYKVW